ncbi:MAG: 30S ribosomal protein S20 [Clostridia bacterium]|nr:30S ribosomal protein S20 [Clostridia bacterium]
MANIKSQKKRILVTKKENARNNSIRSEVKNAVKKYNALIAAGDVAAAEKALPEVESLIMKAKSDGVLNQNTASRKVATLKRSLDSIKK